MDAIMPNHLPILWRKQDEWIDKSVQQHFFKFTVQKISLTSKSIFHGELEKYRSSRTELIIFG